MRGRSVAFSSKNASECALPPRHGIQEVFMIRNVAALVIGVALAFGAGAYAGGSGAGAQDQPACCQQAGADHGDHARECCKDGGCADCGDCAKGECTGCASADCCAGQDCCKDGACAMKQGGARPAECCTKQ
jgi:hypothetical protein